MGIWCMFFMYVVVTVGIFAILLLSRSLTKNRINPWWGGVVPLLI